MESDQGESTSASIRLSVGDLDRDDLVTGQVVLVLGGDPVRFELTAPAGPATVWEILPVLQGLSSFLAERAEAKAQAEGRAVSCRAGCGACCRQLVPISPSEARALARLVDAMPEQRRARIRQKFEDALEALNVGGVLERLVVAKEEGRAELGMDYFRLGVACPFLEAESCSIHPDRPLSCREYLVTSPAENCQAPSAQTIQLLKLDGDPSTALLKAEASIGWMALVLALRFDEQEPPEAPAQTGPEILRDLLGRL
jgi:Fe-S-cluster containining protein